jgi:hypothetical protein
MAPKSMVLKIARRWIQLSGHRPIAAPVLSMTVETGPLTVVERLALRNDLSGTPQWAREGARFDQFVGRHPRLHHTSLSSQRCRCRQQKADEDEAPA